MDLTAEVSVHLPERVAEHRSLQQRSSTLPEKLTNAMERENIYEELKLPPTLPTPRSPLRRSRPLNSSASPMKKGISEPNLAKGMRTSSPFFSPRGWINRMKRMLPLSLSRQSLTSVNGSVVVVESDDSTSTSSDNNEEIRMSRLDHVNRVKNVYDTLSKSLMLMSSVLSVISPRYQQSALESLHGH